MGDASARRVAIDRIEEARRAWERWYELSGGDRAFVDVSKHLAAWRDVTVARLEAAKTGAPPAMPWPEGMSEESPAAVDEVNAWFAARDAGQTGGEVAVWTRSQFARIVAALEGISDEDLQARPAWLDGYPLQAVIDGTLEHFWEHVEEDGGGLSPT